jgi:hypothetical protein
MLDALCDAPVRTCSDSDLLCCCFQCNTLQVAVVVTNVHGAGMYVVLKHARVVSSCRGKAKCWLKKKLRVVLFHTRDDCLFLLPEVVTYHGYLLSTYSSLFCASRVA